MSRAAIAHRDPKPANEPGVDVRRLDPERDPERARRIATILLAILDTAAVAA